MRRQNVVWFALAILALGLIVLIVNHDTGTSFGLANEDFGSLVYIGALLSVICAGLVFGRHRFGEVARNLGIWAALILVLMAGYLYRYELQDVASRLSAGLVPGSPLSLTDNDGRVRVQIERAPNGHYEVEALAKGESLRMVVDTGATVTVLTTAAAQAAGIDVSALAFNVPISTANGSTMAAQTRLDALRVGAIERANLPVLVARTGSLDQSLLGMNFIGTLAGFDMRGDRLILYD